MNDYRNKIIQGDCLEVLKTLPDGIADMCVTSPPYYGLRDYGVDGQIGLEPNPEEYIKKLVEVFREVGRVIRDDGTLWVNIGDSYWGSGSRGYDFTGKWNETSKVQSGSKGTENLSRIPKLVGTTEDGIKNKDLIGIPWLLALALRKDGWYLRQDIIWHKPNPMPESVMDRCTKSHEYIFLLSKNPKYYFDHNSIQEDGIRNMRDVWSIPPSNVKEAHFATMPERLAEICILAGSRKGGIVIDPFFGSGTTGRVATKHYRDYIGIELNPNYIGIGERRNTGVQYSLF